MLDAKYLRSEIEQTAATLEKRGYKLDVATFNALEAQCAFQVNW